jgi:hypothetical protein
MTGFRNKFLENIILDNNGFIDETITKHTNLLICIDVNNNTKKI